MRPTYSPCTKPNYGWNIFMSDQRRACVLNQCFYWYHKLKGCKKKKKNTEEWLCMGNVQLPLHRNSSPANHGAATQYIRGCGEVQSWHRNGEERGIVVHLSISQAAAHLLDSLHNSLWALQRAALKKRQYLMSGSGEEENIWLSLFVACCSHQKHLQLSVLRRLPRASMSRYSISSRCRFW